MTTEPRLTIGIPTFNRPERLQRAIQSALGQSVPVSVIVADQGKSDECENACKEWVDHPHFLRVESPANNLWENWRFVAETAIDNGAEFFTWLQDDDLLAVRFARRVVRSFDYFPDATVYCANLCMAYDNMLGNLWEGNWGPKVPCDILYGQPQAWPGNLLVVVGYFDAWCMSPAKSFRVNDQFKTMLATLPDNCDCYTERLDIAGAAINREFIVDPSRAGYWIIHGRQEGDRFMLCNESQISGGKQEAQVKPAYEYLDTLMDQLPGWRQELAGWLSSIGHAGLAETCYKNMRKYKSQSLYAMQIAGIFEDLLERYGRLEEVNGTGKHNGQNGTTVWQEYWSEQVPCKTPSSDESSWYGQALESPLRC